MAMPCWRFVSNQNTQITGINDAGIETFSTKILYSLVRESIQNSLDAQKTPANGPVHVEFTHFVMSPEAFPGYHSFRDALQKCRDSNLDEPQANDFFSQALHVMNQPIHVLRVSDHNTCGLRGARDGRKGSDWSRLVKEQGSSNKHAESGGSFGIGKAAAFACSQLRCVVYASRDEDGTDSHFGVARLISFLNDAREWTTGTGYYSLDEKFVAILENRSYDPHYVRNDSGTDIYIFGVPYGDEAIEQIRQAVLINFFVSIYREKLIVSIEGETIDKNNLSRYISQLNPHDSNAQLAAIPTYFRLIEGVYPGVVRIPLKASEYGAKYGFADGECTLYLMEGENLNRRVLMTRSAGMSLFEQDRFKSNIMFTGLLVIEGENMNRVFKEMEVPSHDAWVPGRCKDLTKAARYDKIYSDLRKYLRDKVRDCFAIEIGDEIEAFGAGEFLPDLSRDTSDEGKKKPSGLIERLQGIREKKQRKPKRTSRPLKLTEQAPPVTVPPKERKKPEKGPESEAKKKNPSFKPYAVKTRAICTAPVEGAYMVRMVIPQKAKKAEVHILICGESGTWVAPIQNARLVSPSSATLTSVDENRICLENLEAGAQLVIDVSLDVDTYCGLEVQYYASKR